MERRSSTAPSGATAQPSCSRRGDHEGDPDRWDLKTSRSSRSRRARRWRSCCDRGLATLPRVRRNAGPSTPGGGTPREVLEGVLAATGRPMERSSRSFTSWASGTGWSIPIGRSCMSPILQPGSSDVRFSPEGEQLAFAEHPVAGDRARRSIGRRPRRAAAQTSSPSCHRRQLASGLRTETRSGSARPQRGARSKSTPYAHWPRARGAEQAGPFTVMDVSNRGQASWPRTKSNWTEIHARARGAGRKPSYRAELSFLSDLSDDGETGARNGIGLGQRLQLLLLRPEDDGSRSRLARRRRRSGLSPTAASSWRCWSNEAAAARDRAHGRRETRTLEPGPVFEYSARSSTPSAARRHRRNR